MLLKSHAVLVPALLPSAALHRHGVFLSEELNHKPDCLEKNESKKRREIIFQLYQDWFPDLITAVACNRMYLIKGGGDAGAIRRNQQLLKLALVPKTRLLSGSHGDREGCSDSVPCSMCHSSVTGSCPLNCWNGSAASEAPAWPLALSTFRINKICASLLMMPVAWGEIQEAIIKQSMWGLTCLLWKLLLPSWYLSSKH